MKTYSADALAALADGTALVAGAVEVGSDPIIRVWSGYGVLSLLGNSFDGLGDRMLAQASAASLGSAAQAVTITLSGVEGSALELLDAGEVRAAPAILWRLIFNGAGTRMLDAHVYTRGRLDQLSTQETIGGDASISVAIESAARGLHRRGGRMRSNADQRLVKATDGGLRAVSFAGQKTLYWGGMIPATAGHVLNGGSTGRRSIDLRTPAS